MTLDDFFYVKPCLGKNRKPIRIYKIRTLKTESNEDFDRTNLDRYGKPINDPRVTKLGGFLRKYWIDELPQLVNLVKGDLKLIGIRPRTEEDWISYPSELMTEALKQKPGLIGIEYAYTGDKGFKGHVENIREYIEKRKGYTIPALLDSIYLTKIIYNIIFKGVISS